jgi:hypothetical protein
MAPSWTGRLFVRLAILVGALGGLLGGLWVASGSFGQDPTGPAAAVTPKSPEPAPKVVPAGLSKPGAADDKTAAEAGKPVGKAERKQGKGRGSREDGRGQRKKGSGEVGKPGRQAEEPEEEDEEEGSERPRKTVPTPGKQDAAKSISLADAITLAEKSGKGEAIRAEKRGKGSKVRFTVDLLGKSGDRTRVSLNSSGTILDSSEMSREERRFGRERPERQRSEREHE